MKYVVLFDGHCPFCSAQARRLTHWATRDVIIETRDFQEPHALDAFPSLTQAACMAAMKLVASDGHIYSGAEAVARLLMTRRFGFLAFVYYMPVVRWLCERAYRFVSKRRYAIAKRNRTLRRHDLQHPLHVKLR